MELDRSRDDARRREPLGWWVSAAAVAVAVAGRARRTGRAAHDARHAVGAATRPATPGDPRSGGEPDTVPEPEDALRATQEPPELPSGRANTIYGVCEDCVGERRRSEGVVRALAFGAGDAKNPLQKGIRLIGACLFRGTGRSIPIAPARGMSCSHSRRCLLRASANPLSAN